MSLVMFKTTKDMLRQNSILAEFKDCEFKYFVFFGTAINLKKGGTKNYYFYDMDDRGIFLNAFIQELKEKNPKVYFAFLNLFLQTLSKER